MRDELHLMQLVDRYLDGGMDEAECIAFEERMRQSDILRGQVDDQRALREGLHRVKLRGALDSAHRAWVIKRWSPWMVAGLVVLVGGYWSLSTDRGPVTEAALPVAMPVLEVPQAGPASPSDTPLSLEELDIQVESVFVRSEARMQVMRDTVRGEGRVVTHLITDGDPAWSTTPEPTVVAGEVGENTGIDELPTSTSRQHNAVEKWRGMP